MVAVGCHGLNVTRPRRFDFKRVLESSPKMRHVVDDCLEGLKQHKGPVG